MATTYRSRKAKGSRHEAQIAKYYTDIGIEAKRMPLSGADSMLKGDIAKRIEDNYLDECKNQETLSIWKWWRQTEEQAQHGEKPVLHFTANNKPELTTMRTEDWFNMRKEIIDLQEIIREKPTEKKKSYDPHIKNKLIWELEMSKTKLNNALRIAKRSAKDNE